MNLKPLYFAVKCSNVTQR